MSASSAGGNGVLRRFFTAEGSPVDLAIARILVFGLLLDLVSSQGVERFARIPVALRVPPTGWGDVVTWLPLGTGAMLLGKAAAAVFCALALVGWRSRWAAALATLASVYVLAIPELFGKVDHKTQHLLWFGALLAFSPAGDALSVDRWIRRRRGVPAPTKARGYALPLRFMWLSMGVLYFVPGLAKLAAGPEWFTAPNLELLLHEVWLTKGFVPGLRLDQIPLACRAAAVGVVAFELGFVFLILSPRTRPLAALGGVLFHSANAYFLHISFGYLVACYALLIDWDGLLRRFGGRIGWRSASAGPAAPEPPAPAPDRCIRQTVTAGTALLLVAGFCNAADINAWPFSRYPRFERIRTEPVFEGLEIVLEAPDGTARPLRTGLRAYAITRILELRDPAERAQRLRAIHTLLVRRGVDATPGDRLRIYAVTRSTRPEDGGRELRRVLLLDEPMEPAADDQRGRSASISSAMRPT